MNEYKKSLEAYKEYFKLCMDHLNENNSVNFAVINKQFEYRTKSSHWDCIFTNGFIFTMQNHIYFRRKKRTVVVNGKTVPVPTTNQMPEAKIDYYSFDPSKDNLVAGPYRWTNDIVDRNLLRFGWFDNEQDASEYFKALMNI